MKKDLELSGRQIRGLKGAIKHWYDIANFGAEDEDGGVSCPLCVMYAIDNSNECNSCPVYLATGHKQCRFTPFSDWTTHLRWGCYDHGRRRVVRCKTCQELANEEFEFLKSILERAI